MRCKVSVKNVVSTWVRFSAVTELREGENGVSGEMCRRHCASACWNAGPCKFVLSSVAASRCVVCVLCTIGRAMGNRMKSMPFTSSNKKYAGMHFASVFYAVEEYRRLF
jgi:hypothetical protein